MDGWGIDKLAQARGLKHRGLSKDGSEPFNDMMGAWPSQRAPPPPNPSTSTAAYEYRTGDGEDTPTSLDSTHRERTD